MGRDERAHAGIIGNASTGPQPIFPLRCQNVTSNMTCGMARRLLSSGVGAFRAVRFFDRIAAGQDPSLRFLGSRLSPTSASHFYSLLQIITNADRAKTPMQAQSKNPAFREISVQVAGGGDLVATLPHTLVFYYFDSRYHLQGRVCQLH
jgi:hypothetical protein